MPEGFEGGADAWGKLDDAGKTAANTAAAAKGDATKLEAWTGATDKAGKIAAWQGLNKDQRTEAFKGLSDDAKKELGLSDPAKPIYGDFKLPEGVTVEPERIKAATDLFSDSGLTQEQAQKFMDMHIGELTAAQTKSVQDFVNVQNSWVSEIKADPEIGGDKLTASLADAARAIDRLGGQPLRDALNLTGGGNNPAIAKAFVRAGQMLKEDRFAPGDGAAPTAAKSPAETIYDGQPKA